MDSTINFSGSMRILIAPDKFKGSLSGFEAAQAIANGISKVDSSFETHLHPLADGGEGTLELLDQYLSLKTVHLTVNDPLFRSVKASYRVSGDRAFIELSAASGLQLLEAEERNCLETTTLGTGELVRHALDQGAREIFLTIGGSATTDGGMGIAHALGFQFLDANGQLLDPVGKNLLNVAKISVPALPSFQLTVICDVLNPFYGPDGAAFVYGPQKGATREQVKILDEGLRNLAAVFVGQLGSRINELPGAGAAGGVGGGMVALLSAKLESGIDFLMNLTGFEDQLKHSDLVISGEGKLDLQTLQGKVIAGVGNLAHVYQKPFFICCGVADEALREHLPFQACGIVEVKTPEISTAFAMANAGQLLENRAFDLIKNYLRES